MVTYIEGKLLAAGWRRSRACHDLWTRTGSEFTREEAIVEVLEAESRAAYERGLRRGMAIAREHEGYAAGTPCYTDDPTVDWEAAEEALQREVYAAAMGEEMKP